MWSWSKMPHLLVMLFQFLYGNSHLIAQILHLKSLRIDVAIPMKLFTQNC